MSRTPSLTWTKTDAPGRSAESVVETDAQRHSRAEAGLDWFSFFCANLQTGFGPFVSVYLTTQKWSQTDIGIVLMIGGFVGLLGQIPGGAIVDRSRAKALIAAASVIAVGISALLVASSSVFAVILIAWVLHAAASCFIMPCILTISLALVGHDKMSRRIGRNATFASVGSALAAGGMGACGYYLSNQAVFFVTAALTVPALLALLQIRSYKATGAHNGAPRAGTTAPKSFPSKTLASKTLASKTLAPKTSIGESLVGERLAGESLAGKGVVEPIATPVVAKVLVEPSSSVVADLKAFARDRRMVVMASTITLYYLASASMLPLIGSMLTLRSAHSPTIFIAACIIVPQVMIAVLSPLVGAKAQSWGRRPLLLIGLATVPLRGLLLGALMEPSLLVVVQILDGMCSAIIGVLMPLVASDVTRNNGRFALAQGIFATAMGVGASFSSTVAGVMTDRFGSSIAFFGLAAIAVTAFAVPLLLMPETRKCDDAAVAVRKSPSRLRAT